MSKNNNSYESNDSSLSSGSDTIAPPLDKTLEKLDTGKATVTELMLPAAMNDDARPNDDEDFVRSSASPDNAPLEPFKELKLRQEGSPEISNQDVKIREYLKASAINNELVDEETIAEPTVVPSFLGNTQDLSFHGIFGPKSPENLFDDDYDDDDIYENSANSSGLATTEDIGDETFRKLLTNETRLLKRMQRSLNGVLPPPSVTTSAKITISELLDRYHANSKLEREPIPHEASLFQPNCEEIQTTSWPDSRNVQGLGVCYNRSRNTEKIETIALDLVARYVGCETISSYTTSVKSPQSTKKRAMKSKAVIQSPGRRLSHLARRRAIFSSANLKQGVVGGTNRQIVLNPKGRDQKKLFLAGQKVGRTPKRRTGTPSKRKTPRSSKKKPRDVIVIKSTITREQSKRALFQSPATTATEPPKLPMVSEDVAKRVEKSKRALFSPVSKKLDRSVSFNENNPRTGTLGDSRYKSLNNLDQVGVKRKRIDDDSVENWSKMPRLLSSSSNTENECPSSSRILKSQSFQETTTKSTTRTIFNRSQTDINDSFGHQKKLSETHKQKLLWAVATALKNKNIISSHPDYKKYASNLTRIVKTLFLQLSDMDPQITGIQSTSEKLKRIANNHVYSVIKGISYETIIAKERERLENLKTFKKLEGYVAPEDYKQAVTRRNSSFYSQIDSSVDSSIYSQSFSQVSSFSQFSHKTENCENIGARTSSSKKNGDNFALKENQRSTQKSQTKKIQAAGAGNVLKAKRQISFDN